MLDDFISDRSLLKHMVNETITLKKIGYYNGAYECVKLAVNKK